MGKSEDEVDESKVSWALVRKMFREQGQAAEQMQEEAAERAEKKFAKTWFGRKWVPVREQLKKTKSGRRWLAAFLLFRVVLFLAVVILVRPAVTYAFDNWIFPPDYKLTEAQGKEGYDQTLSSGKSASPEHVYFRFYEEADYKTHSECGYQYDWCVFAIPAYKDCEQIYMEFSTKGDSTALSPVLEHLSTYIDSEDSQYFPLGVPQTIGITVKNSKSQYGSVDHIYCRGK